MESCLLLPSHANKFPSLLKFKPFAPPVSLMISFNSLVSGLNERIRFSDMLEKSNKLPFQHAPSVIVPIFGITSLNDQDIITS